MNNTSLYWPWWAIILYWPNQSLTDHELAQHQPISHHQSKPIMLLSSYPKMPFFWWIFILGKQLFVNESCLKGLLRALIKAGWIRLIREIVEILKSDKLLGRLQLFWADAGLLGINFGIVGFVLIAVWRKARYFPSFLLMNEQDVQGVEFVGLLLNAQGDKLLSH